MNQKKYTGVGSRDTPDFVCKLMSELAYALAKRGYKLRSGHADGADLAFEMGCDEYIIKYNAPPEHLKEIWIPWRGFNKGTSLNLPSPESFIVAQEIHPAWSKLKDSHKSLHARNCHQVLGPNLDDPSSFLICWTEKGEPIGGTRTAIVLAKQHRVPVLNLGKWKTRESMEDAILDFFMLIGESNDI